MQPTALRRGLRRCAAECSRTVLVSPCVCWPFCHFPSVCCSFSSAYLVSWSSVADYPVLHDRRRLVTTPAIILLRDTSREKLSCRRSKRSSSRLCSLGLFYSVLCCSDRLSVMNSTELVALPRADSYSNRVVNHDGVCFGTRESSPLGRYRENHIFQWQFLDDDLSISNRKLEN